MQSPAKRVAAAFVIVACIAVAVVVSQYRATRRDKQRHPEPGQLVDVSGMRLMLHCSGAGSPTVILESGLGGVLREWSAVQNDAAKFARVCSYDRAGYGSSDAGPFPRTSERIAEELHTLLTRAGERPPYILVGHSFGGYNVRVFHGRYPQEVRGIVLVDAVQEDEYTALPPVWETIGARMLDRWKRQARWAPLLITFGVLRVQLMMQGGTENTWDLLQTKYLRARTSELENMRVSAEQARAAGEIGDKPLLVLSAGKYDEIRANGLTQKDVDEYRRAWRDDLQLRLAKLSSRGERVIVADSGHNIPGEKPEAVVSAIREIRTRD